MRSRLDLLDSKLTDRIWSIKEDAALRFFACECASLALIYCGNGDSRSKRAVEVGHRYAQGMASDDELNAAYADAERAAEAADEAAFKARDAFEEGKAPASEYTKAFGAAGAAFSAKECCQKLALAAANDAAYEACTALRTAVELGNLVPPSSFNADIDAGLITVLRNILEKVERSR